MSHAGIVVAVAVLVASALARAATRHLERRPTAPPASFSGSGGEKPGYSPDSPHQNGGAGRWHRADRRRVERQLPEAVAAVARGLRSGASLRRALAEAAGSAPAPLGPQLQDVMASVDAGVPLTAALDTWAEGCPDADASLVATALALAEETGGPSAQAVDGVAATLRRRLAGRDEAVALAAQARLSAVVLGGLPPVVCLLTLLGGGSAAGFLLGTPAGGLCLVTGLALDLLGAWWMARLMRTVRPRRWA
jgi:tight adherence protein B